MNQLVADRPDFVFTTTTRPRNTAPGDEMPASYLGIWQRLRDNNIAVLGMRDTPWLVRNGQPFAPADCLAEGGDAISCGTKRPEVLVTAQTPRWTFWRSFRWLRYWISQMRCAALTFVGPGKEIW